MTRGHFAKPLCDECGKRRARCVGYYGGSCTAIYSCKRCCKHEGICTDLDDSKEGVR